MKSFLTQVGITSDCGPGGCGQKGVPSFYTSVGQELCFINFASACLTGNNQHKDYFDYSGKCRQDWEESLRKELDEAIEQAKKEQEANPDNILLGIVLKKKEGSKKAFEELLDHCGRKKQQLLVSYQNLQKNIARLIYFYNFVFTAVFCN